MVALTSRRLSILVAGLLAFGVGFGVARLGFGSRAPEGAAPPAESAASHDGQPAVRRRVGSGVSPPAGAPPADGVLRGEDAAAFLDQLAAPDDPECDRACVLRTTDAMDVALRKMLRELYAAKGPASRCAPDGLIDDTLVNVRYRIASTATELRMTGVESIDEDLPADVRACLDKYLDHTVTVTAKELHGPLATAEFETLDILATGDLITYEKPD